MTVQRMPRAELEARPGDWPLTNAQVLRLSLFAGLRRKPNLDRFPGAVRVRTYRPGETIYWQGEPGWTAFYVLTTEDVLSLRQEQLALGVGNRLRLSEGIGRLRRQLDEVEPTADANWRVVGHVHVATHRPTRSRKERLARAARIGGRPVPGTPARASDARMLYVPLDGPATFSYDTERVPLCEGELIGETSCMYRTPRPATVVVNRDCHVLEILRNILDQMYKDTAFRESADLNHPRRDTVGWRNLSLLAHLSDQQYVEIRDELRLVRAEPGTIICDEHEPAEAVYLVRSGLVRVARNVSSLLTEGTVRDWPRLRRSLMEATGGALARLRELLAEQGITLAYFADPALGVRVLNCLLARADLTDDPALVLPAEVDPGEELATALVRRKEARRRGRSYPDREARRCNRLLLEALLPGVFQPLASQGGLETILTFRGPGEWFGEPSALANGLHDVTCAACGHPDDEGMAEVVRVPSAIFAEMLDWSPVVQQRVKQETERRRDVATRRMHGPLWTDAEPVQASRAFEELGLLQGQKLMVIDLERCTRCNECVKACVDTHPDGVARLALDGPRFGKFLVPMTCRSCLDPVCLIGCPVGSIHRAGNRQIVIEDWCIGCGLCAERCPYGSIQMRDRGILPESSSWRFAPGKAVTGEGWSAPGFRDEHWPIGEAPVRYDRELFETLPEGEARVRFRHAFRLDPSPDSVRYRLQLTSRAPSIQVFVNGIPAEPEGPPRQGNSAYSLGKSGDGAVLRAGRNVIAVSVALPGALPTGEVLLGARLDEVRRPHVPGDVQPGLVEDVTEKQVTHQAVVCDLCSDLPGQGPACVRVCPHEAALRVDARTEFPDSRGRTQAQNCSRNRRLCTSDRFRSSSDPS